MYLGYLDDSGDPGVHAGSPTPTFTTACVLVRDAHWVGLFEDLIRFRRYLRQNFGLRMRQEVRATELVRGSGPWATLPYGDQVRKRVFRSFMRLQGKVGTVQSFAVVIDDANKFYVGRGLEHPGIIRGPSKARKEPPDFRRGASGRPTNGQRGHAFSRKLRA
jgi:hypothetical protein